MAISIAATAFAQSGATYSITKSTIDSGCGKSTSASYSVTGTIGQHDAGDPSGATYTIAGGFWSATASPPPPTCSGGTRDGQECRPGGGTCDLPAGHTEPICFGGARDGAECCPGGECGGPTCSIASAPVAALPNAGFGTATRHLAIQAGDAGVNEAIRVIFTDLEPPYDIWNGTEMWVQAPSDYCEKANEDTPPCTGATWKGATLGCTPHYREWTGACDGVFCIGGLNPGIACTVDADCQATIHVFHEGIIPQSSYTVEVIDETCNANDPGSYSTALAMATSRMGDCCGNPASNPPNGAAELPDVIAVLQKFANDPSAPIKAQLDHATVGSVENVDHLISLPDVIAPLKGFANLPYPGVPSVADPCPAAATLQPNDFGVSPVGGVVPVAAVAPVNPERIAALRLVPDRTVITRGGLVTVDVFVEQVLDMQGYQLALDVSGGMSGMFAVEDVWVDLDRPDHALDWGNALDAVDLDGKRLLATQIHGATSIDSAAYLASFQLRASDDASGEFTINLRWDDTLLMTPAGEIIRATLAEPASVRVMSKEAQRAER